jgi:hypothetical protein
MMEPVGVSPEMELIASMRYNYLLGYCGLMTYKFTFPMKPFQGVPEIKENDIKKANFEEGKSLCYRELLDIERALGNTPYCIGDKLVLVFNGKSF